MAKKPKFDFDMYAAVWYKRNNWKIPRVHMKVFKYLNDEATWDNETRAKVLLLWRGIGKSTITDIWIAYKLTINPKLRFLILSADAETAKKSSMDILNILRNHPLSEKLVDGDTKNKVTRKDSFFVNGSTDSRNPSVRAIGILSNITGGRADYIVFDDVEVPKNSGSERKRNELRSRINESNNLLVPETGYRLFIGTYHDPISIYDEQVQLGAHKLRVPIIEDMKGDWPYLTGESLWPERFSNEWIVQKQKSISRSEFYSQYLLVASSARDAFLDIARFNLYSTEVTYRTANGRTVALLGDKRLTSVSCWWDPSVSTGRGDDSVLAIVYTSEEGDYYIHRTQKLKGDTEEQISQMRDFVIRNNIPAICVETNGIGAMLPPMMIKALAGTGIGVNGVFSSENKNLKILRAYEVPLYAGRIYIHESVEDGKFLRQVQDFDPTTNRNADDYIDAVASCILREPNMIGMNSVYTSSTTIERWLPSGTYDLKVDY